MANLVVEGIPPGLLHRLAITALANGRCVNSEVILSLVRHLQEQQRSCPERSATASCPFRSPGLSEGRRQAAAPWGDPG